MEEYYERQKEKRKRDIQAKVMDVTAALRKYCGKRRIKPIQVKDAAQGRHKIIELKDKKIYFLYKREPFYFFAEKFPTLRHPAIVAYEGLYKDYGESINSTLFERAAFKHKCNKLVIFYGKQGKAYEGDLRTIYEFAVSNDLRRKQKDGEETLSFPCYLLRDSEQTTLGGK